MCAGGRRAGGRRRSVARVLRHCLLLSLVAVLPAAPASAAEGWHQPVPGAVARAFTFSPAHPFAAGARRGLDLATAPRARVRAPCRGRVTFAGRVPAGAALSLRCGAYVATLVGVRATVPRGSVVARGAVVGRATRAVLRLGARRAGEPWGYVDPTTLMTAAPGTPPPVAAPGRVPRGVQPPKAAGPGAGARAPGTVPLAAWLGLAGVAAGAGAGVVAWRRPAGARRAPRAAAGLWGPGR